LPQASSIQMNRWARFAIALKDSMLGIVQQRTARSSALSCAAVSRISLW
jgi:hypothetical protein